jgi:hypothetical protein
MVATRRCEPLPSSKAPTQRDNYVDLRIEHFAREYPQVSALLRDQNILEKNVASMDIPVEYVDLPHGQVDPLAHLWSRAELASIPLV